MVKKAAKQPTGLIDPRYCCCAVPLVNVGIYSIILEQLVVGIAIGACAVGAPKVVGTSYASFGSYIFGVMCFLVAACQPIGWIGALREKTSTFKVYKFLNLAASLAAFIVAAALIIVSATRHNTAVKVCKADYYSSTSNSTSSTFASASNTTLTTEGNTICPPLVWADVGIMGGLWVIIFLCQAYFIYLTFSYSTSQVSDHKLYHSVYSENPEAFTMSILRSSRYNPGSVYNNMPPPIHNDVWDHRESSEIMRDAEAGEPRGSYYDDPASQPAIHGYVPPANNNADVEAAQYSDADGQYDHGSQAYPNTHDGYGYGSQPVGSYPSNEGYSNESYGETPPSYGHADQAAGVAGYGAGYGHSHQYSTGGGEQAQMNFPQATTYATDQKHPMGPR